MAEWLALPTSGHEVPGSNPAGGGIQLMTVRRVFQYHNQHLCQILKPMEFLGAVQYSWAGKIRAVRGSDYTPAAALSGEKYI